MSPVFLKEGSEESQASVSHGPGEASRYTSDLGAGAERETVAVMLPAWKGPGRSDLAAGKPCCHLGRMLWS